MLVVRIMNKLFCDVVIFGAGIIGSSLALRLSQAGITVFIIDTCEPFMLAEDCIIPYIRVSAINYESVEFFKKINIWNDIPSRFYTSYRNVEVWEWSGAIVKFHAESIGLTSMGCIIENNRLKFALWKNIKNTSAITFYCPSKLIDLDYNNSFWECTLSNNVIINSSLLIGADGMYSQIRKKLGIGVTGWEYNQNCMLLMVKTEYSKLETIWQIFTPSGPIGFLPLYDNWGMLMWFNTNEHLQKLQNLPKWLLEKIIRNNFYEQLGEINLYDYLLIPLINQRANRYIAYRGALVGDSAHTIHPMTGQGINLGIRDVIKLSELLINASNFNKNYVVLEKLLKSYQNNRQYDICLMQSSINYLYFIFHNNFLPLKIARNIAFLMLERFSCFSYIKRKVLEYATGLYNIDKK